MSIQAKDPLPSPKWSTPAVLTLKRIQMYVLEESFNDRPAGYHIYLRLSAEEGYGWSELILNKADKPRDWTTWCGMLLKFIDSASSHQLPVFITPALCGQDDRLCQLIRAAAHRVGSEDLDYSNRDFEEKEPLFFTQAISYISLF